jgi:hypothetical protein
VSIYVPGTNFTIWYNNYTIANGTSALVDGAKRDRIIWPGDMTVAVPSVFVSTNDLITIKNTLDALWVLQEPSGKLAYAGYPFSVIGLYSFTYHLYTLIGLNDYYLYSGDSAYLADHWDNFKRGMNYTLRYIDNSGMLNVTSANDWGRFGMGGHNIEANAILYYTINLGLGLAKVMDDTSVASAWQKHAQTVKAGVNALLWDGHAGLYRDNETTTLHPQDGNAWAVVSNITSNSTQMASISEKLASRWTKFGAPAPECGPTISPFISSIELQAHYIAGQPDRAMELIRLMWADFMLDDPRMTNSSLIEGYAKDGTLHYAPYTDDTRISHAHGWSSGPTNTLTFFAVGLSITGGGGQTWTFKPNPGTLKVAEAGFTTGRGSFAAKYQVTADGWKYSFQTPDGTRGSLSINAPEHNGSLTIASSYNATRPKVLQLHGSLPRANTTVGEKVLIEGLQGGNWTATFKRS